MRLTDITLIFTDGMALRAHNLAKHFILLTYLVTYFLIHCLLYPLSVSSVSACLSVTPALSLSLHLFLFPLLFLPASQSLSACLCLPVYLSVSFGGGKR